MDVALEKKFHFELSYFAMKQIFNQIFAACSKITFVCQRKEK